jgi:hypothetical protein
MSISLAEFIHRQNIRHYTKELSTSTSGPRRKTLLSLIAVEAAKADKEGWPQTYD